MSTPEESANLSAMIAEVMKNPEVSRMVAELKANMASADPAGAPASAGGGAAKTASAGEASAAEGTSAPAAAAPNGAIPPDVLAKLPEMMAVLGKGGSGTNTPAAREAENRRRLLSALKPYLNPARKDAVESILKVTQITDLFGTLPESRRGGDG